MWTLHEVYIDEPDFQVALETSGEDVCIHVGKLGIPTRRRVRQFVWEVNTLGECVELYERKRLWAAFPAENLKLARLLRLMPMTFSHNFTVDDVEYVAYRYDKDKTCPQ